MHGAELRKFRKEREIRCAVCTELFTAVDARAKYCSNKCRQRAKYQRIKGPDPDVMCARCGADVYWRSPDQILQ